MPSTRSQFGSILSDAFQSTGIPNLVIAAELRTRGHKNITLSTLDSWKRGNSLPLGETWAATVTDLETIFGLEPHTLADALKADSENLHYGRGQSAFTPQEGTQPNLDRTVVEEHLKELNSELDWNYEAYRKTMEEDVTISADRHFEESRITLVVQLPDVPQPTLHLSTHLVHGLHHDADDIGIYDIRGATVGETITKELDDGLSKTMTLLLPQGRPGQLHQVQYVHRVRYQHPLDYTLDRLFLWHLLLYKARVTFEGSLPNNIRWEIHSSDSSDAYNDAQLLFSQPLTPIGNTVSAMLENPQDMWALIRWDNA